MICGKSRCSGTPERTLTSDLSLRRRSLYTTELLGHIQVALYPKKQVVSRIEQGKKKKWVSSHILVIAAYTVRNGVGGDEMRESDDLTADLEDLIYDEDSGHPSER